MYIFQLAQLLEPIGKLDSFEIEQNFLNDRLKTITVYYGNLMITTEEEICANNDCLIEMDDMQL